MNYDRIILELMDRVSVLEKEVAAIKTSGMSGAKLVEEDNTDNFNSATTTGEVRDTTKYIFEGRRYGKNRLVLAVIKHYVLQNKSISAEKLMTVFDRSIQGSLGVVRTLSDVKSCYGDYERRFFTSSDDVIYTSTSECVVCTQWSKFNIGNFITRAEQLGMHIQTIGEAVISNMKEEEIMDTNFAMSQLIGQGKFMELYSEQLENLHSNPSFMSFVKKLRQELNGAETANTKSANVEIMNAFFYSNANEKFEDVVDIVNQVKQYGKQASAHISIYYAMYVLDFQE